MDPRNVVLAIGRTRIAVGLAALVAPRLATRMMFGRGSDSDAATHATIQARTASSQRR